MAQGEWVGDEWSRLSEIPPDQMEQTLQSLDSANREPGMVRVQGRLLEGLALKETDRILELGVGMGHPARHLERQVGQGKVTGLDNCGGLLKACAERSAAAGVGNVEWVEADARQTGLPDKSYDVVYENQLLEHIGPLDGVLGEAKRLLKPAGRLGLLELAPPTARLPEPHVFHLAVGQWADTHHDPLIGGRLEEALRRNGFRDIRVETTFIHATDLTLPDWWNLLQAMAEVAVAVEAISEGQSREWLEAVRLASKRGECMIILPVFLAYARAPGIALRKG